MSPRTERMSIRLPLDMIRRIEKMAIKNNISKAKAAASLIEEALDLEKNLNTKILIELLIILRSSISGEKEHQEVLKNVDKFKEMHGLNLDGDT